MEKAKSGQQQSEINIQAFRAWVASKSDEDFKQYEFRGQLSRTDIAKECGFGKSALTQNPTIKAELAQLENQFRARGILPPLSNNRPDLSPDVIASTKAEDSRIKRLEGENAMLRAELENHRKYIKRYDLIEHFLAESMRMPR